MSGAWQGGFEKVARANLAVLNDRITTIRGWMEDIDEGKSLIITYVPDAGVRVESNGTLKGTLPGDDFAEALFSIWPGPKSLYGSMRSSLLQAR